MFSFVNLLNSKRDAYPKVPKGFRLSYQMNKASSPCNNKAQRARPNAIAKSTCRMLSLPVYGRHALE
jgi:hypothetical protein